MPYLANNEKIGEKRGDTWRTKQVYRCGICHAKTNKWIMGGWPSKGPRLLCPGDKYEKHDELESIIERRTELESRYETCASVNKKKARDLNELLLEIELLGKKIEELREKFPQELDDVEGVDATYSTRKGGGAGLDKKEITLASGEKAIYWTEEPEKLYDGMAAEEAQRYATFGVKVYYPSARYAKKKKLGQED